jgi:hypothetical protein
MKTNTPHRWHSYTAARSDEVLKAYAAKDTEELLRLIIHHLGTAARDLEGLSKNSEDLRHFANYLLNKRLLPSQLALALIADPSTRISGDDADNT